MVRSSVLAAMAFALAGSASAMQSPAPRGPVTLRSVDARPLADLGPLPGAPEWERQPDEGVLAALYPDSARPLNLRGETSMSCRITASGTFTDCVIVSEAPAGRGFGRATLQAARYFRMRPTLADGRSVAGYLVEVSLAWAPPPPPMPVPGPGSERTASPSSPAGPSPQAVSNPDWGRMPTGDDLARVYPRPALSRGLSGRTKMSCKVRKDGTLTDCAIVQEDPPGYGFGDATLAVARYFRMTPTTADGKSVEGGTVIIPIAWRLAP
jgi:TonB family protein